MSSKSLVNLDLSSRETAYRPKFGVSTVYGRKQTLSNNGFDLGRECQFRSFAIPEWTGLPRFALESKRFRVAEYKMARLENFRLKVFRSVAEHLSFRKAAEHLFISQPAVTLQIKALESDLGVRLFDRGSGRITLTQPGSVLVGYANKIASIASEAERELSSEHDYPGELSLGVSTTIAQYVFPRLLGRFLSEYPRVQFSLRSGNTHDVVQLLLEGAISVGLIEGPLGQGSAHETLHER